MSPSKTFRQAVALISAIVVAAAMLSSMSAASAQSGISVALSLQVTSSSAHDSYNGLPEMISGVWNYLNLSISPEPGGNLNLVAFYGSFLPSNKTIMDYYEWSYSSGNNSWFDPVYGSYVNSSSSSAANGFYSFVCGMFDKAYPGEWTLELMNGSTMMTSVSFYVTEPSAGMTFSAPDFELVVAPYTYSTVSSSNWSQYAMTTNTGSIPETISFSFPSQDYMSATANTIVLQPGQSLNHFIVVTSGNWTPQLILFSGTVTASFTGVISANDSAQYTPVVQFPLSGTIEVGHSGYVLGEVQNVTVQFRQSISAAYARQSSELIYLSGSGVTDVSVASSSASILYISGEGQNSTNTIQIVLPNGTEVPVLIGFKADERVSAATISITLSAPGSPFTKTFSTQVAVTGLPANSSGPGGTNQIFGNVVADVFAGLAVLATAASMIVISRLHPRSVRPVKVKKNESAGPVANRNRKELLRSYKGPEEIKPRKGWNR